MNRIVISSYVDLLFFHQPDSKVDMCSRITPESDKHRFNVQYHASNRINSCSAWGPGYCMYAP